MLLGCLQPGQGSSTYSDAFNRLADRLHYLGSSGDKAQDATRFWFDIRANLRREMEDRKRRFDEASEVRGKIAEALKKLVGSGTFFDGVHIFTPHADVPDDSALRLVVLSPEHWYSRDEHRQASGSVLDYIHNHGTKPRHRGNRLLFLAPDMAALTGLRDAARVALAWNSIVDDAKEGRLNIERLQKKQAGNELQTAEDVVICAARECYKWLLCPVQDAPTDQTLKVEAFPLTTGGLAASELERVCTENELVITTWSPIHLRTKLEELYWKEGKTAAGAMVFWEDTLRYLYMPRFKNRDSLTKAIRTGAACKDFFGMAYGQSGASYEGFHFGDGNVQVDDTLLLIEPETARAHDKAHSPGPTPRGSLPPEPKPSGPARPTPKARSFFGTAEIAPSAAKMGLVQLADEIISVLCSDPNGTVKVTVQITAEFQNGVSDQIRRTVTENASSLGFKRKTWE